MAEVASLGLQQPRVEMFALGMPRQKLGEARLRHPEELLVLPERVVRVEAEDNDINAVLARAALTKAGHEVEVVGNGKAAVDALTAPSRRFDVVLMDLHMPLMDGLDAIAHIRRHEAERGLPPIPVLVLSADGQEVTRQSVLTHGANGFLSKPLDPGALVVAVEEQAAA